MTEPQNLRCDSMTATRCLPNLAVLVLLVLAALLITPVTGLAQPESKSDSAAATSTDAAAELMFSGETMGTTWSIKAVGDGNSASLDEQQLIDELIAVNQAMSTWDPTSELSRFNASSSTDWFEVSNRTVTVVAEAIRIAKLTDGAFDPTVSPLIDLWNFGSEPGDFKVPSDSDIESLRPFIGYEKLEVRTDPPALKKQHPKLTVNLSAIAKGYGVDAIADVIRSTPSASGNFIAEIGGEVVAQGTSIAGIPWRVGIEAPLSYQRSIMQSDGRKFIIPIDNLAMATSGDYRSFFEADGIRYSHTISPTTGRPVTHDLVSVTVLHSSCMTADALATSLLVMGPEAGYNLAQAQQLPVLMLIRRDGKLIEKHTRWFPELPPAVSVSNSPRATNMRTFIVAAVVFLLAVTGMAIGVIVSNRKLKGSCGGLSAMQNGDTKPMCEMCSIPPEECDTLRDAIKAEAQKSNP